MVGAGALGSIIALTLLARLAGGRFLVALVGQEQRARIAEYLRVPAPAVSPTPVPRDSWQKIITDAMVSTVLIQTYSENRLVRTGTGSMVSSDGLIITTSDVVSGQIFQVIVDDKILKARILTRQAAGGLALLKVDADNLTVSNLNTAENLQSGKTVILAGKLLSVSAPTVFSQLALVSYTTASEVVLDSALNYFISGAKVIGTDGAVAGIAAIRGGKVVLIPAGTLEAFLRDYLASSGAK